MRSVRVLEAAEAAAWYETQRSGFGHEFRLEFKFELDRLREGILPGTPWPGRLGAVGVKRLLMRQFPFSLVFVIEKDEAVVLAVAHHRRRPAYWRPRLSRTQRDERR